MVLIAHVCGDRSEPRLAPRHPVAGELSRRRQGLLSDEHFAVDETWIEVWASLKSFKPRGGTGDPPGRGRNAARDFHGETRSNATHASTTDAAVKPYRKSSGIGARLCFMAIC
jgi:hypothetical protein